MPQADECLRAQWPGGDSQALDHLSAKGFIPTRDFCWIKPYKDYHLTNRDNSALDYLFHEWDYGGIIETGIDLRGKMITTADRPRYHQPRLTAAEQYILGWIAEEGAESIKMAVGKTLRFGFRTPGRMGADGEPDFSFTPENKLHSKLGDLLAAIELGFRYGVFQRSRVMDAKHAKIKKVLTENDNLGRPLAPPLPELPIYGPDGEIWESNENPHIREVTLFTHEAGRNITHLMTYACRVPEPKKQKTPWRKRLFGWVRRRKNTNDRLDFG